MSKFRQSDLIEAVRYDGFLGDEIVHFLENATYYTHDEGLVIANLDGNYLARPGDWIIKGRDGEFFPCRPDVFNSTYELVED